MKYFKFLIILLLLAQTWFIYVTIQFPYTGIRVQQNDKNQWIVSSLEDPSPELLTKIHLGDIVTKIDGEETKAHNSVNRWRTIDQANNITIVRDGNKFEVSMKNKSFWEKLDLLPLVGEGISLFFAGLIYLKIRNSVSANLLYYLFLSIAAVYMSISASSRGDVLGKIFVTTGVKIIPIIFLHFLIVFLREKGNIILKKKFLNYLYGSVIVLFLLNLTYFIPNITYFFYKSDSIIMMVFFIIGFLLNFTLLTNIYIKYRNQSAYMSIIIKTIWFSLVISFGPFAFFSSLPMLLHQKAWLDPYYTSWIILFFPVTFAYLIISKQLYDIEVLLRRILFTTIISVLPSISIVALYDLFLQIDASFLELVYSFIIVLLIFSFVLYSLEYLTSKFEPIVFPRKHQLQSALRKISKNLGSISSFREMKEIILVDIVQTLQVYGGAVVFKYANQMETISEGDIDTGEVENLIEIGWFEDHPAYTCFVINHHEEYTSYLVMARKKTNTVLGLEDRQWLSLIISYLAVSLENVYLIRKLTMKMQELAAQVTNEEAGEDFVWFRKLMFELQEKERVRIATDLHDTTMQDLFFLKKRFASIMDKLNLSQTQYEHFRSIIEFVEIINTNLRQSCFDLHPHLLQEIGFVQTVEKLVERESYESPFEIQFSAEKAYSIENRDLDTKRHLFRMVQELITNAKKHSQATKVKIQLIANQDVFRLTYADDGVGFDEGHMVKRKIGATGIGMEQIKSRTLYLNGHFDLQTAKGRGVKIQITIPIREGLAG